MQGSSPCSHAQFFKSLRHLEKRIKLEGQHSSPPAAVPEAEGEATQQTDSLGTPIYLACNNSVANTTPSDPQESEAPREFMSSSPDFSPTPCNLHPENQPEPGRPTDHTEKFNLDDEIEQLMGLLRLPKCEELKGRTAGINDLCGGDDGFYGKIVGVKGPKSGKEAERLDGWIEHYAKTEVEPLRLAHLLMGKAAFAHSEESDFGGFEFPSTIQDFLQTDPPATE